jgi:uncharacterized protein YecT (DUF1311 family)
LRPDKWYAGKAQSRAVEPDADEKESGENRTVTPNAQNDKGLFRLRVQGNTLRIDNGSDNDPCIGPDKITGSYFPTGSTRARTAAELAASLIAPSFDCGSAKNLDEEEICADPDLARNDSEIARIYTTTLRWLDAKFAGHLRDDQRAWAKENVNVAESWLNPAWDKRYGDFLQPHTMREELENRQKERLAMLSNLDETRRGLAGIWMAHNAMLTIEAAQGQPTDAVTVKGNKWETGDYKSSCEFDGEGRIVNGVLTSKHDQELPALRRDGATLTIDGNDPDPGTKDAERHEQPIYCSRMRSAKARLFPVKSSAVVIGIQPDRIH